MRKHKPYIDQQEYVDHVQNVVVDLVDKIEKKLFHKKQYKIETLLRHMKTPKVWWEIVRRLQK